MRSKLDSEELGIITRNSFMEEFFPEEPQNQQIQNFHLYHHNALPQSNAEGKVSEMCWKYLKFLDIISSD